MLRSVPRTAYASLVAVVGLVSVGAASALADNGIGWRTDGSGSYPKAQPPLEWSPTKNVIWRTAMPGYGVCHPVLLDKRIIICAEPATLLCLDRNDGKILWQKTSTYAELEIEPEVREQLKMELEQTQELSRKQSAIQKERDLLHRSLVKDKASKEEMETMLRPFDKQIEDLNKEKLKLTVAVRYTPPGTHPTAGYSAPTPVTNGKEIFVAFGNGLMAC